MSAFVNSLLFHSSACVSKANFPPPYLSSAYPRGYDWISDRIALLTYVLWGLNYQQLAAFRNLHSCESEMTFSETDWRLQHESEVDLELLTKPFCFDLLWHLSLRYGSVCDMLWQQSFMQLLSQYYIYASQILFSSFNKPCMKNICRRLIISSKCWSKIFLGNLVGIWGKTG